MKPIVDALTREFLLYKRLAEGVFDQLSEDELATPLSDNGNSVATLVWHVSGNLRSRFTDFLTTDGEKAWRGREEEFSRRRVTHDELAAKWNEGWDVLLEALDGLDDADLAGEVTIRGTPFPVHAALHRSLAHTALHVGQMMLLGKTLKGEGWRFLTIPPGQSEAYNKNPTLERRPTRE